MCAMAGCGLLVELDRSAVDAGGSEISDEGIDSGEEGASGAEAAPTEGGGDATNADGAVGHSSPEH
jgi:hypothetical protein